MPLLTVEVTEQDIDKGFPCDTWQCPIAQAMWRITGQRWVVRQCYMQLLGTMTQIDLPIEAQNWLLHYDGEKTGEPFKFQIEVPA